MSKIGKLGFGLMRLPLLDDDMTHVDVPQLCQMIDLFMERGFTYFDTSFVYHNGASESSIRQALVERFPRESYQLASKLPAFIITEEKQVSEIFDQQLKNCGVDYFDYYLLHNVNGLIYDGCITSCHMFENAKKWKEEGRIKKLGFSFHDSAEVLERVLIEHPETDFVQIALNYYDWESYFIQAKACYDVIHKFGKEVIVMEPVKGGMLAKVPEVIEKEMKQMHPDMSPASWAIRFAGGFDVLTVLSGMSNLEQVEDNTSYMQNFVALTKEEEKILKEAIPCYKASGVLKCADFSKYEGIMPNGMPVAGVLDTYQSCLLQSNPYFGAEHNYYKGVRHQHNISGSWIESSIIDRDGNDITEMVKEAEEFLLKNSF